VGIDRSTQSGARYERRPLYDGSFNNRPWFELVGAFKAAA